MSDEETRDEAPGEDTVIESIEPSPEAESEFHPFDEIDEDFKPAPAVFVNGPDGLPMRVDQTSESDIPALSKNSLVCMGDFTKFVLRDRWGDIIVSFEPSEVDRAPNGEWRVKTDTMLERAKLSIGRQRAVMEKLAAQRTDVIGAIQNATDAQILVQMLLPPGEMGALDHEWVRVLPVRPACKHYVRQQGSFSLNAAKKAHYRLCSARRTTEGTFMTVRDTGMWACDMREPYDAETIKVLDDFDNRKIAEGANREFFSIFQSPPTASRGSEYRDQSTAAAPQKPKEEN